MGLTDKQINDLNNMNVAAQNVHLGTLLDTLISNSGGTEKFTSIIVKDSYLLFPNVGEDENLYVDRGKNEIYRWDNKDKKYFQISYNYNEVDIIIGGNANG